MENGGSMKREEINLLLISVLRGCQVIGGLVFFIIPLELRIEKTRLTRPVNLRCDMKIKNKKHGTIKFV